MRISIKVTKDSWRRFLGMSLLERVLFELSRCGIAEVFVALEEGELPEIIRRPDGMKVQIKAPDSDGSVTIDSSVVYKPKTLCHLVEEAEQGKAFVLDGTVAVGVSNPEQQVELNDAVRPFKDPKSRRRAKWILLNSLRKPLLIDGVVGYVIMRPVTLRISAAISKLPITPNMVTLFCLVLGITGALLAGTTKDLLYVQIGAFLYFAGATLDCVDGELSRLKFMGSKIGAWLDTLVDDSTTMFFNLGLALYLFHTNQGAFCCISRLSRPWPSSSHSPTCTITW